MLHEDVLNKMLGNSCHNPIGDGFSEYKFQLCCATLVIVARLVEWNDDEGGKYEIKSMNWVDASCEVF